MEIISQKLFRNPEYVHKCVCMYLACVAKLCSSVTELVLLNFVVLLCFPCTNNCQMTDDIDLISDSFTLGRNR